MAGVGVEGEVRPALLEFFPEGTIKRQGQLKSIFEQFFKLKIKKRQGIILSYWPWVSRLPCEDRSPK